jgi:methylenetetrahydrofolate reductase (NADPH)
MKIKNILSSKKFTFSMEVFPPKPDTDIQVIYDTIEQLKELKPDFISVTYGAGGSTRNRTVEIADRITNHFKIPALAHLTCIGATESSIMDTLNEFKSKGVENIMALRGDLPAGVDNPLKDFKHASDLVRFIKKSGFDFCVGVACYPETHQQAVSSGDDLKHLKEKVDAGADFMTTQLFLDNDYFYGFRDRVEKAGINVPLIAGIMTATKLSGIERMTAMSGAKVPERFWKATSSCEPDNPVCDATVQYTIDQINHLIKHGVKGIHLYSMNKVEQNKRIYYGSKMKEIR